MRVTVSKINLPRTNYFSIYDIQSRNTVVISTEEAEWVCASVFTLSKTNYFKRRIDKQSLVIERIELNDDAYAYGISDYYDSVFIPVEDMMRITLQLERWIAENKLVDAITNVSSVEHYS